jgi:hypothetical protein
MLVGQYHLKHTRGRYYAKAQNLSRQLREYNKVLASYDLLLMPTTPMKATPLPPARCSLALWCQRAFEMLPNTAPFDVTGHPAMSIPCGMSQGLPVGLQLVGRRYEESTIYRAPGVRAGRRLAQDVSRGGHVAQGTAPGIRARERAVACGGLDRPPADRGDDPRLSGRGGAPPRPPHRGRVPQTGDRWTYAEICPADRPAGGGAARPSGSTRATAWASGRRTGPNGCWPSSPPRGSARSLSTSIRPTAPRAGIRAEQGRACRR